MIILPPSACEEEGFKDQEVDILLADGTICRRCWINQKCELEGVIVGGRDGIKPFGNRLTRRKYEGHQKKKPFVKDFQILD